jgi:predicted CoA-binding protein
MASKADVDSFFTSPAYAVVGVSADRKKFGNTVFRTMKEKGITVYPVHPTHETVEGEKCYSDVKSLPAEVSSIVTVVPPAITKLVVEDALARGVKHIWMQPGSNSSLAAAAARKAGASVVDGECILMFLEPVGSVHKVHRFVNRVFGKMPR